MSGRRREKKIIASTSKSLPDPVKVQFDSDLLTAIGPWYLHIQNLDTTALTKFNYQPQIHLGQYDSLEQYFHTLRHLVLMELKYIVIQSLKGIRVALNANQPHHSHAARFSVQVSTCNESIQSGRPMLNLNVRERNTYASTEERKAGKALVLLEIKNNRFVGEANVGTDGLIGSITVPLSHVDNIGIENGLRISVFMLAPLTPIIRTFEACVPNGKPGYLSSVIRGELNQFWRSVPSVSARNAISLVRDDLNDMQHQAAARFIDLDHGLQLLWGPPGTGKSTTIMVMLKALINSRQRAVVSAHSNKAVAVLVNRFIQKSPTVLVSVIADVGHTILISNSLTSYKRKLQQLAKQLAPLTKQKRKKTTAWLQKSVDKFLEQLDNTLSGIAGFIPAYANKYALLHTILQTHQKALSGNGTRRQEKALFKKLTNKINQYLEGIKYHETRLLKTSHIVFGTLSAFGKMVRVSKKKKISMRDAIGPVAAVIVDEAGQTTEADIQPVFSLEHHKALLVGDPKQLPPTIIDEQLKENGFDVSMMARLMYENDAPFTQLQIQYRMAPEISVFPNRVVYNGLLIDGANTLEGNIMADVMPYAYGVIDFAGGQEERAGTSWANNIEALQVVRMVAYFKAKGIPAAEISVVTPYRGQVNLIRQIAVQNGVDLSGMHLLNTVDASQGDESDVVILSLVRANKRYAFRFLENENRLNVALTRARKMLLVLCNAATFNPFHPQNSSQARLLGTLNSLIPTEWDMGGYQTEPRFLPMVRPDAVVKELGGKELIRRLSLSMQGLSFGVVPREDQSAIINHKNYEQPWELVPSWKYTNYDYDYDDDYDYMPDTTASDNFFSLFEEDAQENLMPRIGQHSLFHHPRMPIKTFGMQLLVECMKDCRGISMAGIPVDTFAPIKYYKREGRRVYSSWEAQTTKVTLAMNFGEDVWIQKTGYPDEYPQWWTITYPAVEDLVFNGHNFTGANLSAVDFHNSKFLNCIFKKAELRDTKIKLAQMDDASRLSFEKARFWSHGRDAPIEKHTMPMISQLVLDSQRRGVFFSSNTLPA